MNTKEITVLMVEPGQHPKVMTLKDALDSLQKAVSIGAKIVGTFASESRRSLVGEKGGAALFLLSIWTLLWVL